MNRFLIPLLVLLMALCIVGCSTESDDRNHEEEQEEFEFAPGLYQSGSIGLYVGGMEDKLEDKLIATWDELLEEEIIVCEDGMVHTHYDAETGVNDSAIVLAGDLILPDDGSVKILCYSDEEKQIGYPGFTNCDRLTGIYIPASVEELGSSVFEGCISLTTVIFDENINLENISFAAFRGCTNLVTITIPDSVTMLRYYAFSDCSQLSSIHFGTNSKLKSLQEDAFRKCAALTNITLPESLKNLDHYVFNGCKSLTSITMPSNVSSLGERVFQGCTNLERVVFTGDSPYMEDLAFENMNLTIFYPANNPTWTNKIQHGYGGNITWIPN